MRPTSLLLAFSFLLPAFTAGAQAPITTSLVEPPPPLLGPSVAGLKRSGNAVTGEDAATFDAAHAAALSEDGLRRWARATYAGVPVEALEFHDVSGATAAFALFTIAGARGLKATDHGLSAKDVWVITHDHQVTRAGSSILLSPVTASASIIGKLAAALPKATGERAQQPLLPTLLPAKGLVSGSPRYALGPAGYAATGGALNATTLGWEKNAEAVIAQYADKRGQETLTLLLYPTPQIAGQHTRDLESSLTISAKIRREGELVAIAQGTFAPDAAQNMIENIHLRSEVTFDQNIAPSFSTEVHKTYSLLSSIAVLFGVLGLAAVLLGLFLGVGRASLRRLRGKDAASEAEFLSLHLDHQNPAPRFAADSPPPPLS